MEKSFVFTETMRKVIDAAPIAYQLDIYKAITQYGLYGEMPEHIDPWVECVLIALNDQFR